MSMEQEDLRMLAQTKIIMDPNHPQKMRLAALEVAAKLAIADTSKSYDSASVIYLADRFFKYITEGTDR